MRNLLVATCITLIGFALFSSNSASTDILYWSADHRLTWDDFKGVPAYQHQEISAITASGIVHYKGCKDGFINYKVQAYFERKESWVKREALTDHHLIHEQIHFDITELNARKVRKALSERQFRCGQENEFELYVASLTDEWQNQQAAYDMDTKHSLDEESQHDWHQKINEEMAKYSAYEAVD